MDLALILELLRSIVGGLVIAAGLLLIAGGAIGVLRFPDFYTRLHAASVVNTIGAVVVIGGLAILAPDWSVFVRLILLGLLIAAVGPVSSQLSASAAHAAGLTPIAGRYTAPRPGAHEGSS